MTAMIFRLVHGPQCQATGLRTAVRSRQVQWFRCFVGNGRQSHATGFQNPVPRWQDRRLAKSEEPVLGAHLITPRVGYVHHGIYLGSGRVIHCGAVSCFLPRGPVEEVSLRDFRRGGPVAVRGGVPAKYEAWEIVDRARSRLGEDRYRLFTNNCEHFCEWCVRGEQRSYQVERLSSWMRRLRLPGAVPPASSGGFSSDERAASAGVAGGGAIRAIRVPWVDAATLSRGVGKAGGSIVDRIRLLLRTGAGGVRTRVSPREPN
jgi:hypothetical protein